MKKLFTILGLLCLTMVAQAQDETQESQEVTTWETAGMPVTFEDFVASAGTGKRYAFRMPSNTRRGWCNFTSQAAVGATNLAIDNLFTLEKSTTDEAENAYKLKRHESLLNEEKDEGLYLYNVGERQPSSWVMTEGEATDLYLQNRRPTYTDPEEKEGYGVEEMDPNYISFNDNPNPDNCNHFNNGNFGFFYGKGGFSAYFAYGPLYVVKVVCEDQFGNELSTVYHFALDGATFTFNAPEIPYHNLVGSNTEYTVTVNGADVECKFEYEKMESITYTLNIVNAPAGVKLTIDGEPVALDATEYVSSRVLEKDDIEVDLGGLEYKSSVTVDGTTITIKFYDNRYGVNFDPEQTYTHTIGGGRKTHWVALGDQKVEWEFQGVGVEPVYRDMTNQTIKVPVGATVTPSIGFEGGWMHGFLYIDYNKNGQYDVDVPDHQTPWSTEANGELVSYKNEGNVLTTNSRNLPDITLPDTCGIYRVRFKVDWASTDPGGNPGEGEDPEDITNHNHIVANGGTIIDVMLETVTGYTVTYKVLDESGAVLKEKTTEVIGGTTIDAVPADLLLPDFYDYSEVTPVTVSGNTTITTTATPKAEPLFQFTADTTNPVWYNLTIRPDNSDRTGYPTYDEYGYPNVTLPTTLTEDETTQWAFIGSPYAGFQIVNNAATTDLVLGAANAYEDSNGGGATYATLDAAGTPNYYQTWMVESSDKADNGFYLYNVVEDAEGNSKNQYLNRRSDANLAFWTGGKDIGSTFIVTKPRSGEDILAEAQKLLDELTEGANEVQIGYPNADALAAFQDAINEAAEAFKGGSTTTTQLKEELNTAIEDVTNPVNVNHTPRTDVYYTITNARGSIVYNPEKAENVDGDGNEFLWFTKNLNKDSLDHQWGIYKKGDEYYLYNVGKQLFANVTLKAAEGKTIFDDGTYKGNWIFSKVPAAMKFDGGDAYTPWVAAPNVRIQGDKTWTDELDDEYTDTYTMSISPSFVGPVITYDGTNDGGVPMNFAIATTTQNPEVTAAIEKLLDPTGIEVINGQTTVNNGAIYNLQGQKVKKAQKGVYIQNGKKVVLK